MLSAIPSGFNSGISTGGGVTFCGIGVTITVLPGTTGVGVTGVSAGGIGSGAVSTTAGNCGVSPTTGPGSCGVSPTIGPGN